MFLFISIFFIIISFLFLWTLLISNKNSKTIEEQYIEDSLQMQYLKEFAISRKKFTKFI